MFIEVASCDMRLKYWDIDYSKKMILTVCENVVNICFLEIIREPGGIEKFEYKNEIEYAQFMKNCKELLVITKLGEVEIIILENNTRKTFKSVCKKASGNYLLFNDNEIFYAQKKRIKCLSLTDDKLSKIKIPFKDSTIHELNIIKETEQIVIRTEKIIYIMEYLDPTELGIKAKFEMKNNIIGMAMNDTYLAYFDLTEPDINVVTISTLKSSTIHKDFDVYLIEIANQNLIALGVNTFITYRIDEFPFLPEISLLNNQAINDTPDNNMDIPDIITLCMVLFKI